MGRVRTRRPRGRADALRLSAAGQLTILIPELIPDPPPGPAWDATWRRCLSYKRCAARVGDKTRCRTRATPGGDRCRIHA